MWKFVCVYASKKTFSLSSKDKNVNNKIKIVNPSNWKDIKHIYLKREEVK